MVVVRVVYIDVKGMVSLWLRGQPFPVEGVNGHDLDVMADDLQDDGKPPLGLDTRLEAGATEVRSGLASDFLVGRQYERANVVDDIARLQHCSAVASDGIIPVPHVPEEILDMLERDVKLANDVFRAVLPRLSASVRGDFGLVEPGVKVLTGIAVVPYSVKV